jgi:iron complex outermembrane recepter protein
MSRFRPTPTTLAISTLAALLAHGGPALAQSAPQIERIEVSAQRRIEPLQDVPAAVNALNARQLEARGVTSTEDFVSAIPNMSFDSSFTHLNSFVVLRGVTQINNADSPVAIVVDGVPQNNQKQFRMNLFDIQRIEVLKGPQGALYGRNALGGAINIVTKAPSGSFEGFGGLNLANGKDRTLNAGISGPMGGAASFRLVAQQRESDGLIRNDYLQRKVDGIDHDSLVRGKLSLSPGKDVTVDVQAGWNDFKAGATHDSVLLDGDAAHVVNPVTNLFGKTFGSIGDASVKVDLTTGIGTLSSITAYTDLKENYRGDLDFSNPVDLPTGFLGFGFQAGQGQDLKVRMTSQELRLTSPDTQPIRSIVGVYALRTDRRLGTRVFIDQTGTLDQIDTGTVIVNQSEKDRNTATAVFGQVDVDFGKQTTLSMALRHDRDERRQTDLVSGTERKLSFSKTQPKLTLTHKWHKDALVYATASTGFRSGGLNAPGLPDFRAETLSNFEVGSKNTLLGGAMVLNLALFEARSKDFQFFYVDAVSASQIIGNIDRVRMRGLDLDARWRLTRDFEMDAGLGITNSIIRANSALPDTVGNHTPKNTPLKATLGAQYEWTLGGGSRITARADVEHRSKRYWQADNVDIQPALDLLNLRVSLGGPGDRWSVALWGKNLTDEAYYTDVNAPRFSGLPYTIGWRAQGRTFGVDAKLRF